MDEEFAMDDPTPLLLAASDFAHYPGVQNDDAARAFLDRFPLPVIINALQMRADVPGLESTLVDCLERVFKTKYGASLIPHFMSFVQVGLKAESQSVRCLSCKTVSCLLENFDDRRVLPEQLIINYEIYPLLLDCLVNGNEEVAAASLEAIKKLANSPKGMAIIFPINSEATHLGNLAARCSSLGRVRVLSLIVKLFSVSTDVASAIHSSNLLSLLEADVSNTGDTLLTLSVLELLYELAEVQHGAEFLSRTTLLQLLSSIMSNTSVDAILRSRSMMISGRLLSKDSMYTYADESCVRSILSAIDRRLSLKSEDENECESAIEALGQIGLSIPGATMILSMSPSPARYVIDAAFNKHSRGRQLAALHSLGNISGEARSDGNKVLSGEAEENLRRLIYETASRTPKLIPSGLFLSVLQQDSEVRLGAYRMLAGLVSRPWCLMEIFSKQEIVNIVTDPDTETTKIGMEAKYGCCKAILKAFTSSSNLSSNPNLSSIAAKLQVTVGRGPYLTGKPREAQPAVKTAERF